MKQLVTLLLLCMTLGWMTPGQAAMRVHHGDSESSSTSHVMPAMDMTSDQQHSKHDCCDPQPEPSPAMLTSADDCCDGDTHSCAGDCCDCSTVAHATLSNSLLWHDDFSGQPYLKAGSDLLPANQHDLLRPPSLA